MAGYDLAESAMKTERCQMMRCGLHLGTYSFEWGII